MKKSNFLYIFINIFLLLGIMALNYFADPYFLFNKNRPLHINRYLLDEPYIPLKLHKDRRYDYVVVGGSTVNVLNLGNFNKNIADITCFRIKTKDMKKLLFEYLNMHPETKTVFIALDFRQLSDTSNHTIPEFTQSNLTSQDLFRLFLSGKTIKYSVKKIIRRIPDYTVRLVKYKVHNVEIPKEKIEEKVIKIYGEIFDELNKRNIKIVCFIPPSHANRIIYLNEKIGYETLLDIKKFIISKTTYLIDMSTINKFTTKPLKESFYLFSDVIHATDIYGYFVYNILFDTPKKDKDLYLFLTNDSIEKESLIQKQKAQNWHKQHKKDYEYYINGEKMEYTQRIYKSLNDVPHEYRHILNYKKSIFYKN